MTTRFNEAMAKPEPSHPTVDTPWDDPAWAERSDSPWQAGLRWQQAWWRHHHLRIPPGPFSPARPGRLVSSTLALDADPDANFLSPEVAEAVKSRLVAGGGGLVSEDRLRRMLLSSQPMCFNLFGHLRSEDMRDALLSWLKTIASAARRVTRVEVEWAPPPEEHFRGGSAFDAFIEYERVDGLLGFVGIECKYHEDLVKSDVSKVRDVYRDATRDNGRWQDGAADRLDRRGRRQFWLNTLLAQSLAATNRYAEGCCVITACAEDRAAKQAFADVRDKLVDQSDLVWQPWETIVAAIDGHDDWKKRFRTRYLDFSPITPLLADDDPRRPLSSA